MTTLQQDDVDRGAAQRAYRDRPMIFLSHVSADGELTRLLQSDLDSRFLGALSFFNTSNRSIHPGEHWFSVILDRLKKCDVLLAIMSPAGLRSPWVNFEAGAAWLRGASVIPCCAGQVRKASLPAPYSTLQGIDLDNPADLTLLMETVASRVQLRASDSGIVSLADKLKAVAQLQSSEPNADLANLGNRIHQSLEREWLYRRSDHDPKRWAVAYSYKCLFKVLEPTLNDITLEFTQPVEAVSFNVEKSPTPKLISYNRESVGTILLSRPHRRTGSSYAFTIRFDPPLHQGERVGLDLSIDFPEYRVGTREEHAKALLQSGAELVDFQSNKLTISTRVEDFRYRVIIPKHLGASPLFPTVTRYGSIFEDEEKYLRDQPGAYAVHERDEEGTPCWVMEIHRVNPPYHASYKMRWRLPNERDLDLTQSNESP
jgi:hypothetical protein